MNVGDYVRTDIGEIRKVVRVTDDLYILDKDVVFAHKEKIKKISPSIIDLIEVGDYVNGKQVIDFMLENGKKKGIIVDADIWGFDIDEIKSIVTHEMFESMEYKVDD